MRNPLVLALPYSPDSSLLLRRLASLPGLVFLDSGWQSDAPQHHAGARHDILSALPVAVLASTQPPRRSVPSVFQNEPVFAQLQALLQQHAPAQPLPADLRELPFTGGALGYLGYDGHARFGIHDWAIVVDHHRRRSQLIALPGCAQGTIARVQECLALPLPELPDFTLQAPFAANFTAEGYREAFARVQQYIQAGDCYQVNLAQRFSAPCRGNPLGAYLQLRRSIRAPFSVYLQDDARALLSFSPERFLQVRDGDVRTQPIKGTRRRASDPQQDAALAAQLRASEKDRAENLMIVDLLRNDLGAVCETGSVQVDALFELQSFSNVHHLVSSIRGRLPAGTSPLELLRCCFPGGSITGAPKQRAMQIIAELEPHARSIYCGTAGYIGFDGRMDTNILIRSLLWEADQVHCWGGGGLVADSECAQEYQECFDKINNIINMLK
jgi:para-aminobenzoate synthetase component 1